jgi:hypothetical protein
MSTIGVRCGSDHRSQTIALASSTSFLPFVDITGIGINGLIVVI